MIPTIRYIPTDFGAVIFALVWRDRSLCGIAFGGGWSWGYAVGHKGTHCLAFGPVMLMAGGSR